MKKNCPLAVIILTFNEELSLPNAIKSVKGWVQQIFILDSFSTDRTVEIARNLGVEVYQHPFESFTQQRNWALNNLSIKNEWVLFLDADEYLPAEMKEEVSHAIETVPDTVSGFFTGMRFVFLGRGLKHGDIYRSLIRLFRKAGLLM